MANVHHPQVGRTEQGAAWRQTGDSDTCDEEVTIGGTKRFRIDTDVSPLFAVVCKQDNGDGGDVEGAAITAMFFPDALLREID